MPTNPAFWTIDFLAVVVVGLVTTPVSKKRMGMRDYRPGAGAGWGLAAVLTPSSSFPGEGIAHFPAHYMLRDAYSENTKRVHAYFIKPAIPLQIKNNPSKTSATPEPADPMT